MVKKLYLGDNYIYQYDDAIDDSASTLGEEDIAGILFRIENKEPIPLRVAPCILRYIYDLATHHKGEFFPIPDDCYLQDKKEFTKALNSFREANNLENFIYNISNSLTGYGKGYRLIDRDSEEKVFIKYSDGDTVYEYTYDTQRWILSPKTTQKKSKMLFDERESALRQLFNVFYEANGELLSISQIEDRTGSAASTIEKNKLPQLIKICNGLIIKNKDATYNRYGLNNSAIRVTKEKKANDKKPSINHVQEPSVSHRKQKRPRIEPIPTVQDECQEPYIPRTVLVKQIAERFKKDQIVIISGISGLGKTTLAREYCAENYEKYDDIIFLSYVPYTGQKQEALNGDYIKKLIEHGGGQYEEYLENNNYLNLSTNVLVVIDNLILDDSAERFGDALLNDFLINSKAKLLVTTTNQFLDRGFNKYVLSECLDTSSSFAKDLFISNYCYSAKITEVSTYEEDSVKLICERLYNNAMAIRLIARAVGTMKSEGYYSLSEAAKLMADSLSNDISEMDVDGGSRFHNHVKYDESIFTALREILIKTELIKGLSLPRKKLFFILAYTGHKRVAISDLEILLNKHRPEIIQYIKELYQMGYCQFDGTLTTPDYVYSHDLISEFARMEINNHPYDCAFFSAFEINSIISGFSTPIFCLNWDIEDPEDYPSPECTSYNSANALGEFVSAVVNEKNALDGFFQMFFETDSGDINAVNVCKYPRDRITVNGKEYTQIIPFIYYETTWVRYGYIEIKGRINWVSSQLPHKGISNKHIQLISPIISTNTFIEITLPDKIEDVIVDSIPPYWMQDYQNPFNVHFPEGIKRIGCSAFFGCSSVSSELELSNSIESIGRFAFSGSNLSGDITFPKCLKTIGKAAFFNCNGIKTVTFQDQLEAINSDAFEFCFEIEAIKISKSVKMISETAFDTSCSALTHISVDEENPYYDSRDDSNAIIETKFNKLILGCPKTIIPSSVNIIGQNAFFLCKFNSLHIPESVISIHPETFFWSEIKEITVDVNNPRYYSPDNCSLIDKSCDMLVYARGIVPNGVKIIPNSSLFKKCTSIYIPESVYSIEEKAFVNVADISKIVVDPKNTRYYSYNDYALIEKESNKLLYLVKDTKIIPEGIEEIGEYSLSSFALGATSAFGHAPTITQMEIPDTVKVIHPDAFVWCYTLKEIILPWHIQAISLKLPLGARILYRDSLIRHESKERQ